MKKLFRLPLFSSADKAKAAPHESVVVDGVVLNAAQPAEQGGKLGGIKSYLHNFYLAPAIEEIESGKGQGATWWAFLDFEWGKFVKVATQLQICKPVHLSSTGGIIDITFIKNS